MVSEIEPYSGAGPFLLGVTRKEMREALAGMGGPVHESYNSGILIDVFSSLRVHVYYDADDRSEYIEFLDKDACNPSLQGNTFLGKPYRGVQRWFTARDPALHLSNAGLHSDLFGVAIFAPSAEKQPRFPVRTVSIFRRGYFGTERS